MTQPLMIANWKMQVDAPTSVALARSLVPVAAASDDVYQLVVCPSFVSIPGVAHELAHSRIALGAQDVGGVNRGARTGDVSVLDLLSFGCSFSIIGHSERRNIHRETDQDVKEKMLTCVRAGITPILCVGETMSERRLGQTQLVVHRQIQTALAQLPLGPRTRVVVAYEPVWSISPGTPATSQQIEEVFAMIRNELRELAFPEYQCEIVYGGSVSGSTIRDLLEQTSAQGFLIGSESQEEHRFQAFLMNVRTTLTHS